MTTDATADASFAPLLAAAQEVLGRTLGQDMRLTLAERLTDEERRNTVLRCHVAGGLAAHPSSLIVKQVVSQGFRPDAADSWDTQRFFRDWTADQLPGLRAMATALHENLSSRWPDVAPLPVYPAFRI
jgi:hypothetical protein